MNTPVDFRPALAAAGLLTVLAAAYEAAVRWPGSAAVPTSVPTLTSLPVAADMLPVPVAPPAPAAPAPCPPRPETLASSPASRRPWVVRRYIGTVGGQPATAVVKWQNPDSVLGSFSLYRGGLTYTFDWYRRQPGPTGLYIEGDDDDREYGQLTLHSLPDTVLLATWRHAGRLQRLRLRESYAGALRYTFKTLVLASSYRVPEHCDYVPVVWHALLALPRSVAGPPALRFRLASSPTALRRRLRADRDSIDGDATALYRDEVRLNSFGLFSYETSSYVRSYGGTPDNGIESWLFDLRTGQELLIDSQLKLGYERPLRRLLTRHLLHDPSFVDGQLRSGFHWHDDQSQPTSLVNLPNDGSGTEALTLTETGLEAAYSSYSLYDSGPSVLDFVRIPYRELRPLVRPGTPLARMLRARGLW